MRIGSFVVLSVVLFVAIIAVPPTVGLAQSPANDTGTTPFTKVLFADDFENGGSGWNAWSFDTVKPGQNMFMRSGGDLNQGIDLMHPIPAANYSMKAKFRLETTGGSAHFWFRSLRTMSRTGYEVMISKADDSVYHVQLQKSLNGITYRYGKKDLSLDDNLSEGWHQVVIEGMGPAINVSVDETRLFTVVDDVKPILNGSSIMMTGDVNCIFDVDDVEVRGVPDDPYQPVNKTIADANILGITLFRYTDAEDYFYAFIDFFPGAHITLQPGGFSLSLLGMNLGNTGLVLAILFDVIVFAIIIICLALLLLRIVKRMTRFVVIQAGRAFSRGSARVTRALAKADGSMADTSGAAPGKVNDVFISYSHNDRTIADQICASLEKRKIKCWIAPRDVPAGQNYQESIIDAIDGSRVLVLVYSGSSNSSPHVIREITRAVSSDVTLIPFRIEDVPLSKSMEYLMSVPHWMEATEPPMDDNIDRLAARVKSLLKDEKPADEKKKSIEKDNGEGV